MTQTKKQDGAPMSAPTNAPERTPHPTETPEYWDRLAATEEAFARNKTRTETAESTMLHRRHAEEYRHTAARLRAQGGAR